MSVRRMVPFILINIVVSATVVLAILFWWDNRPTPVIELSSSESTPSPLINVQEAVPTDESEDEKPNEAPTESAVEAVPQERTYTVKQGDTLGGLSKQFDVLLVDLMEANGIEDADFVSEGQVLTIPTLVEETPVVEVVETQVFEGVPTPIPTLTASGEVIVEITSVTSAGNLNEEQVSIINSGERQIDLTSWKLEDEGGNIFQFGSVTLFGNGVELIVHTRVGQSGLLDQFWGLSEAVWEPGETVTLRDAEGTVRASLVIPES
ncbi:MAG: lamin tail domain-containing protein [Candidatus Promineifilaceae bacterium]